MCIRDRFDAKKTIHLQYEAGKKDMNYDWEYRFFDDCYEVIGKNEASRVCYSNLGRILEFTGMLVLVEKGNVVRYFMEEDVEKGTAEELREMCIRDRTWTGCGGRSLWRMERGSRRRMWWSWSWLVYNYHWQI